MAEWYVDASFAVHPDFKSHTGVAMTAGKGATINVSHKQNINTRSSTEAELVGGDDAMGPLIWTDNFLRYQGYNPMSMMYQDNMSAILLEKNDGCKSAGKHSCHLNIRYFFITDMKEQGQSRIEYCPTDKMLGDYHTKPLHGTKMNNHRSQILNLAPRTTATQLMMLACVCVNDS
jgi:hypothetical protein